jgi:DNA-binding NarL/FixJ family response regulator
VSKVETLVFSKSVYYLEKTLKLLTKEERVKITGVYMEMTKLLSDLKDINPKLIFIVIKNGDDNSQFDELINYVNGNIISKVILVNFIEDDKFIISEVLSCKDDLNIISKIMTDICKNKYLDDSVYQEYEKLLESSVFNDVLDKLGLTHTEKKILYLKRTGLTRKEIAEKRVVSNETIRNHITNILRKIGANNTEEALRKVKSMAQEVYYDSDIYVKGVKE